MTTARKLGRLPGQIPVGLRDLSYYVAGSLPAPPPSVAVPDIADWGMLANDTYGDCGPAGAIHGLMAAAADTGQRESFPTAQQVVDYYLTYTGGQDTGVVLSQFLAYVRQHSFYGQTISAYAPVDVHHAPTVQTAIDLYDFAYAGIFVTQAMMDAFDQGLPWLAEMTQGEQLGGHCIPLVGYDETYYYAVTWGQLQPITYNAWHRMADEAWAVLTGELVAAGGDGHGINLAALQADLDKLAG